MILDIHQTLQLGADEDDLLEPPTPGDFPAWIDGRKGEGAASDGRRVLTPPAIYAMPGGLADTRRLNDLIAAAAEADDRTVAAFGTVEPQHGDAALAEIDRIAGEGRLKGLAWRHRTQGGYVDGPVMRRFVARAAAHGLVVALHATGTQSEALFRVWLLAEQFPETPFLVLGALADHDQKHEILQNPARAPNVTYDTAGMTHHADFPALVNRLGSHRLVFGSGQVWGASNRLEREDIGHCLAQAGFDAEARDQVLWRNAASFLGLSE